MLNLPKNGGGSSLLVIESKIIIIHFYFYFLFFPNHLYKLFNKVRKTILKNSYFHHHRYNYRYHIIFSFVYEVL